MTHQTELTAPAASSWQLLLGLVLGSMFMVFAAFWETSAEIVNLWSSHSSYNYAFLIIPISLYVLYERREAVLSLTPHPFPLGIVAIAAMVAAWYLADVVDIALGRHIALVGIIQALLLTMLGWRFYWACLFPFMFLWFMVPTGDFMLPVLQKMAMELTVIGMSLTGIPTFTEGFLVETPTGSYTVAPGCAGLNFLLSGAAFALLYGNLQYTSWVKRVACFVIMIVVAIVSNGIRIVGIIAIAHVTDRKIDIVDDHILYGWGFFAVILLVLIWFGMRFQDPQDFAGAQSTKGVGRHTLQRVGMVAGVAIVLAAIVPVYAAVTRADDNKTWNVALKFPESYGTWKAIALVGDWNVYAPLADAVYGRQFSKSDGAAIDVAVSYFWRQFGKREVVGTGNRVYDGEKWSLVDSAVRTVQFGGGPQAVIESRLQSGGRQRLVWHVYWVDDTFVTSRVRAKLLQAKVAFSTGEERAAMIALSTPLDESAEDRLQQFLKTAPAIKSVLTSATASPNE